MYQFAGDLQTSYFTLPTPFLVALSFPDTVFVSVRPLLKSSIF